MSLYVLVVFLQLADEYVDDDPDTIKKRFEELPLLAGSKMLCSLYSSFDTSTKLFAFQSTIVYLMMPIFEDSYFSGLPEGLQSLRTATEDAKCMMFTVCANTRRFLLTCNSFDCFV